MTISFAQIPCVLLFLNTMGPFFILLLPLYSFYSLSKRFFRDTPNFLTVDVPSISRFLNCPQKKKARYYFFSTDMCPNT